MAIANYYRNNVCKAAELRALARFAEAALLQGPQRLVSPRACWRHEPEGVEEAEDKRKPTERVQCTSGGLPFLAGGICLSSADLGTPAPYAAVESTLTGRWLGDADARPIGINLDRGL